MCYSLAGAGFEQLKRDAMSALFPRRPHRYHGPNSHRKLAVLCVQQLRQRRNNNVDEKHVSLL